MDNFIEKLHRHITDLSDSDDVVAYNKAVTMLESLGEHSKNMLQVGILQEKLLKMGFNFVNIAEVGDYSEYPIWLMEYNNSRIEFCTDYVQIFNAQFKYSSHTFQEDAVREIKQRLGGINA